jgi:hypothetical protein
LSKPTLEPKAMAALQTMGTYLCTLKTFKVNFELFKDEILLSGQKVIIDGTMELIVQKTRQFPCTHKDVGQPLALLSPYVVALFLIGIWDKDK